MPNFGDGRLAVISIAERRSRIKKKLHEAELRKREEELITRVTNVAAPPTIPHLHLRVQGGVLADAGAVVGVRRAVEGL